MGNVKRQTETGMCNPLMQFRAARHSIDKHARLRLECQAYLTACRMFAQLPAARNQALHQRLLARRLRRRARPEADRLGAEEAGYIHSTAEEIESPLSLFLIGAEQGRLMFAPRIEQKASAGFNDDREIECPQLILDKGNLPASFRIVGIERVIIERQGNALIT